MLLCLLCCGDYLLSLLSRLSGDWAARLAVRVFSTYVTPLSSCLCVRAYVCEPDA